MNVEMLMFHITNSKNVESIKKNGLKAGEDGYVYLFDGVDVSKPEWDGEYVPIDSAIAINQVGLLNYTMCVINTEGLELEQDIVGEFTAKYQFRVLGDIPKEKIVNYIPRSAQPYVDLLKKLRRA